MELSRWKKYFRILRFLFFFVGLRSFAKDKNRQILSKETEQHQNKQHVIRQSVQENLILKLFSLSLSRSISASTSQNDHLFLLFFISCSCSCSCSHYFFFSLCMTTNNVKFNFDFPKLISSFQTNLRFKWNKLTYSQLEYFTWWKSFRGFGRDWWAIKCMCIFFFLSIFRSFIL